ncbi:saccharopine dehydrogenase family protein [Pseudoalteromonas luteoviolacea]|uniref:saccharopine dehydrogenase family protein n=1 Tax=Pseudoalteromonas luteoviolacea TaxID=43657 RepID=UPI001B37E7DE|nr:SDR family NAD(P)-dependent oxidoreductase [Pseudoalteromonas luteoviolacea]MBQ4837628.1 SDR family NAD(P)-dependent oxidoreductase [Pseudoalteromonas luteoviolacea]
MSKKVIILGGYGNFGQRIAKSLASHDITLIIAGRNQEKAEQFVELLKKSSNATLETWQVDLHADAFSQQLKAQKPFMVIHTGGPYQGQGYTVPKACIDAGAHYIDLADDRQFVCDIGCLDKMARENGVLVVSGASSVPGLSSAVIDHFLPLFENIDSIDIAIAPGNKAQRGTATIEAILTYTGHPFSVFRQGRWQPAYGWMDAKSHDFGDIAKRRLLANVDVPDLALFPERYGVSERVSFQAGLELPLLHWGMVTMAAIAKWNIVKSWAPLAKQLDTLSNCFLKFGSDIGAMEVSIKGRDLNVQPQTLTWRLYAPDGHGPYIPTFSAIIIAKKLLSDSIDHRGATACVGLLKLSEFYAHFNAFGIYQKEQVLK